MTLTPRFSQSFSRRLLFLTLGIGSLFAGAKGIRPALADTCVSPKVHSAFNIESLKSELMVTALSCKNDQGYNAFIVKFRPILTTSEKVLDIYFRSAYGARWRHKHDEYITELADIQSLGGVHSGTKFCAQHTPMFKEVLVLESPADLSQYVEGKEIPQPAAADSCALPKAVQHKGRLWRTKKLR